MARLQGEVGKRSLGFTRKEIKRAILSGLWSPRLSILVPIKYIRKSLIALPYRLLIMLFSVTSYNAVQCYLLLLLQVASNDVLQRCP